MWVSRPYFFHETLQPFACSVFLAEGYFWCLSWVISGGKDWNAAAWARPKAGRSGTVENGTARAVPFSAVPLLPLQTTVFVRAGTQATPWIAQCRLKKRTLTINNLQYEFKCCCKRKFLSPKDKRFYFAKAEDDGMGSLLLRANHMRQSIFCLCMCSFLNIFWIPVSRHVQCWFPTAWQDTVFWTTHEPMPKCLFQSKRATQLWVFCLSIFQFEQVFKSISFQSDLKQKLH